MGKRLVEFRAYKLVPGSQGAFHELVIKQSMPLVTAYGMDVVGFGPSIGDPDGYFFIRAYDSLEHLNESQDEFYSSEPWRMGPREPIVSLIVADANAVMWLSDEAVEELRRSFSP